MADFSKRPFWMHQLVEYILGGALVASGLQSPTPLVPAVLGGIIMLHAAATRGSLAAFRLIDRRLHRVIDPVIIGLEVVGALQPWVDVDPGSQFIIVGIAAVHGVVWFGSSYTEKKRTPKAKSAAAPVSSASASGSSASTGAATGSATDRSTELGRTAGRVVGSGVAAVRRAKAKRDNR